LFKEEVDADAEKEREKIVAKYPKTGHLDMRINLKPIYKEWAIKCPIKVCDENTGEIKIKEKRKNGRSVRMKKDVIR
jgi:hypothetical protein